MYKLNYPFFKKACQSDFTPDRKQEKNPSRHIRDNAAWGSTLWRLVRSFFMPCFTDPLVKCFKTAQITCIDLRNLYIFITKFIFTPKMV